MIDHVSLHVRDLVASQKFYEQALAPLDYRTVLSFPEAIGLGEAGKPDFWIVTREPVHTRVHVAFACTRRETVDEFYRAALRAGGNDPSRGLPQAALNHPTCEARRPSASSCALQRNHRTVIASSVTNPPPTHMRSPVTCWSATASIPPTRGDSS